VLLDRRKVKFWQKIVFSFMALLMVVFLVGYAGASWIGCGDSGETASTLDDRIAALERQIAASPGAVEARLALAETLRRRANQQMEGSQGRTADLEASAAAYEAYVDELAGAKGTKAEKREAERRQVAALEDLVKVYLSMGDFERVTRVYGRLTELRPNKAEYFYDMGRVAINAGDTNMALLAFTRFLELEPDADEASQVREWVEQNASKGSGE